MKRELGRDPIKRRKAMVMGDEARNRKTDVIRVTDTGDVWICPCCGKKYHLMHRETSDGKKTTVLKHDFEEVVE